MLFKGFLCLTLILFQDPGFQRKDFDQVVLYFRFDKEGGLTYFVGYLIDKQTNKPILNVNIFDSMTYEGTVPDGTNPLGIFRLSIGKSPGRIIFDKPGKFKFYLDY